MPAAQPRKELDLTYSDTEMVVFHLLVAAAGEAVEVHPFHSQKEVVGAAVYPLLVMKVELHPFYLLQGMEGAVENSCHQLKE
jgi:hypothetical protein